MISFKEKILKKTALKSWKWPSSNVCVYNFGLKQTVL